MLSRARPMMKLAHARGMSGIPINKVARVYRLHVAGEEDAIKMDALVDEVLPKIKTAAGYDSAARTVCKSEWACACSTLESCTSSCMSVRTADARSPTQSR
mmetsp:Transcript_42377/g.140441  ORF Transcript_42377/g.140441 Transcript_42377/m.140441 type:complete len:101 (+) Transcript_42377:131-433(+)